MTEILERLVAAEIQLFPAPQLPHHFLFYRGRYAAMVERRGDGFGGIGSSGLLVDQGLLAPLVRRGDEAFFVARGFEQAASADDVEGIRRFSADLARALGAGG